MLLWPRRLRLRWRSGADRAVLPVLKGGVLVVGDVMEDIIVRPDGPMVRGSDVTAEIHTLPGGSGANQAMWLARLGVPVSFVARVGADDLPRYEKLFEQRGVTPLLRGDPVRGTGRLVTLLDDDGERSFFSDRGANLGLDAGDLSPQVLTGIGLVHISGYSFFAPGPRAAMRELMALAGAAGIPVSVDPASTGFLASAGASEFLGWTRGAAMLFPNHEEAAFLAGTDDPAMQMKMLGAHYDFVVMKRGAMGAIAGGREGIVVSAAALEIKAVDSTGAGDAFLAGFVAARREGADMQACLIAGNAAGAKAASRLGGQPA